MRPMVRLGALALAGSLVLGGCAGGSGQGWIHPYDAGHPLVGRIYDVRAGRFVGEAELYDALARARFVLLGETHDNADHHRLQARVIRELAKRPPGVSVVAFEMLDLDQQAVVVEHLSRRPADLDAFARAVRWEERGWPDFDLYRPVFEAALEAGARIVAAGLEPRRIRAVASGDLSVLPEGLPARTGLLEPLPAELRQRMEAVLFDAHCGRLARDFLPRLVAVQRARDAVMADRLAVTAGRGRAVLITGRGHARRDFGVPWYLARRAPGAPVAVLAFLAVREFDAARARDLPYDFVWLTPAAHPPGFDPCAGITPRGAEARARPAAAAS